MRNAAPAPAPLTTPASCEGKHDPGIPGYVTGAWKTGLVGGYDEIFTRFREAGVGCYRWDKSTHNSHGDQDQLASIREFLGKCQVFVMLSEKPTAGGGASQLMLGYALISGMPVIFVDPNAGTHVKPGRANRDHPMIANLVGSATQLDKQLTIVKTIDEAIAALLGLPVLTRPASAPAVAPAAAAPTPPATTTDARVNEFLTKRVSVVPGRVVRKMDVREEFRDWHLETYGSKGPSANDLYKVITEKFGDFDKKVNGWPNLHLQHIDEEELVLAAPAPPPPAPVRHLTTDEEQDEQYSRFFRAPGTK